MKNLFYIVLLAAGTAFGQQTLSLSGAATGTVLLGTSASNNEVNAEKEAKGSPYLQPNYMYAFVDDINKPFKMRYNAFSDEMEFDNEGVVYDLDKTKYKTVNFDDLNKKYAILSYQDGNQKRLGFLVEIVSGTIISLYKNERVSFSEGKKSSSGFGVETVSEYKKKKESFFMKLNSGEVIEVPSSKGKFLAYCGEFTNQVEAFIKKNKIDLSDESDLKSLFLYLNTLK